jgi:Xaa-Pro dipeptidase
MLLNRSRAREYMDGCALDALVATSPVNVTYLSDFHNWLATQFREYMVLPGASSRLIQQNFALLPREGEPALVVEPYFAVDAVETWVTDIRIAGGGDFEDRGDASDPPRVAELIRAGAAPNPVDALAAAIEDRGLGRARIGIELDGLADDVVAALRARLPHARLLECSNLLRLVRAVKSEDELQRLRAAAGTAEQAAAEAFAAAHAGIRLRDLEAAYRVVLGENGADFDHFAFGPRGAGIAASGAYTLATGDVVYADWGCVDRGYCSDTGTTLFVGEPSAEWLPRFEATVASVKAGLAAAVPGALASQVQATMRAAMEDAGINDSYPHGHGFGLQARDYPILAPPSGRTIRDDCLEVSSDLPLEEGMVFNLEAPLFVLGQGAVHTERSFVVAAGGSVPLVAQERDAPVAIPDAPPVPRGMTAAVKRSDESVVVDADRLTAIVERILGAAGADDGAAALVACSLVASDLAGVSSHGAMRVPEYLKAIRAGRIEPAQRPRMAADHGALVVLDGQRAFGQVAASELSLVVADRARAHGVSAGMLSGVQHVGRLGEWVQRAAGSGCIALAWCSCGDPYGNVAPFGGRRARLGTNPIAYAIPGRPHPTVVADFSTSVVAEGKVRLFLHAGEPVPEGWLLDSGGRPTTDPRALYDGGAILPAGGHKGFALGLLVEILGGALTGAGCVSLGQSPGNGLVLVAIDPARGPGGDAFADQVAGVLASLRESGPNVLIPGELERRLYEQRRHVGIPLVAAVWRGLVEAGASVGVELTDELTNEGEDRVV